MANLGAIVTPIDAAGSRSIIDWVAGGARPSALGLEPRWALCQQQDGVLWGHAVDGRWVMSPGRLDETRLLSQHPTELRLFGPDGELMIWSADGSPRGRVCTDIPVADADRQPIDDQRIVAATRVIDTDGAFTRVADTRGREQVVPLHLNSSFKPWTLRLSCRHYLSNSDDGRLIVTMSRLMNLEIKHDR